MTDKRIESIKRVSRGATLCLVAAVVSMTLAFVTGEVDWILATIPLLLLAGAIWLSSDPYFAAELHETAIEFQHPPRVIPYANIQAVQASRRSFDPATPGPQHYPIYLVDEDGPVRIPPHLNVPSDDVFLDVLARLPECGSRKVHPMLQGYLSKMEQTFDADKIWTFRTRFHLDSTLPRRRHLAICTAILLTGLLWISLGPSLKKNEAWQWWGLCLTILGGLFLLIFSLRSKPFQRLHGASLVISPIGLALVQGNLNGEMRWDELKDVKLRGKGFDPSTVLILDTDHAGISLSFEGVNICIKDCYDRPLSVIHTCIMRYWRRSARGDIDQNQLNK